MNNVTVEFIKICTKEVLEVLKAGWDMLGTLLGVVVISILSISAVYALGYGVGYLIYIMEAPEKQYSMGDITTVGVAALSLLGMVAVISYFTYSWLYKNWKLAKSLTEKEN